MISVLCVDDDSAYLDLAKKYLKEPGALAITTTHSATEALKEMETKRFDAVVADYQLPGIDGIELLKAVRAADPDLPFIFFTGSGREEIVIEAFNNGADFYIQKSSDTKVLFDDLQYKINQAMRHRKAERDLHNSETRYRRLFETAQDGILILDADTGEITDANPFLLNIIGYSLEELLGKYLWDIGVFKDIDISKKAFLELQTEKYIQYENLPLQKKNGQEIFVEFVSNVYAVNHTNVIRCDIRDITERKQAEEALKESEQKFRDILNNTTDGIHIHEIKEDGTSGRFTDVNDVACRMLGYTKEEMLAKTPLDITTDYHNPPIERIFEEQRTAVSARFETEHRKKDDTIIPVEVNTHVVTIQGKKMMLGVVRDITERKKAEALLKRFNEELELKVKVRTEELNASLNEKVILLREIHHRVKNNLQIIISLVNLQMRQIDDQRLKQVMAETQNRVRAMSLVHEKLYQSESLSKIDLSEYTQFLTTQLFAYYGIDSRRIRLDIDIGKIMVDINIAIPLGLIINELISNALKHAFPSGRKGTITITRLYDKEVLTLVIRDDGIGLPPDLDWKNPESLGLRLVNSLIDQLDGTIELGKEKGTTFVISMHRENG
jgi:PAS domain S-box-containing protein